MVRLRHLPGDVQAADALSKPLDRKRFSMLRSYLMNEPSMVMTNDLRAAATSEKQNGVAGDIDVQSRQYKSSGSAKVGDSGKAGSAHRGIDAGDAHGARGGGGDDGEHGNGRSCSRDHCIASPYLGGSGNNVTHSRDNKHAIHNQMTSCSKDVKSMY